MPGRWWALALAIARRNVFKRANTHVKRHAQTYASVNTPE
jgi:hypothetical protein